MKTLDNISDNIANTLLGCHDFLDSKKWASFEQAWRNSGDCKRWFSLKDDRHVMVDFADTSYSLETAHKIRTAMEWGTISPSVFMEKFDKNDMQKILNHRKRHYPYDSLDVNKIINCKSPKYNIVIPVKENDGDLTRTNHLLTLCGYLLMCLRFKPDWSVTFVIQEDNNKMTDHLLGYLNKFKERYGWENYNLFTIVKSHKFMKKSCCYNLACKEIESKWQINHDVDLLFTSHFVEGIEKFCNSGVKKFFQPYVTGQVSQLTHDETEYIISLNSQGIMVSLEPFLRQNPPIPYTKAPGGSVVVSRDLMVEVGGYDPHIIEGYGPEDSMFWLKLELATLNLVGTGFDNVHLGGGQYSDIVQSQVLHFNHEHGIIDIDNAFIPFAYFVFLRYGDPKERKQFIESLKGLL